MYCYHCGAKLRDGARFCEECGTKIADPQQTVASGVDGEGTQGGVSGGYSANPTQAIFQTEPTPVAADSGQTAPGGKPKKKMTLTLLVLLILALCAVFLPKLFKKATSDSPTLLFTEPTETEQQATERQETTGKPTDSPPETTAPSAPETTVPTAETESAPQDDTLSDAQAEQVLKKLMGYWNTEDDRGLLSVTYEDDGGYTLRLGYWYSEFTMMGYLRQPVKGDPEGVVSIWLYYEGYESEVGYSMPALDHAVRFDLSEIDDGYLRWSNGAEWTVFYYAGATMDEAMPPL